VFVGAAVVTTGAAATEAIPVLSVTVVVAGVGSGVGIDAIPPEVDVDVGVGVGSGVGIDAIPPEVDVGVGVGSGVGSGVGIDAIPPEVAWLYKSLTVPFSMPNAAATCAGVTPY
jgi:hypothetical protein